MVTFMDHYLAGEVTADAINDDVDRWHEDTSVLTLWDYLGLTAEEFHIWRQDASALPRLREARRQERGVG